MNKTKCVVKFFSLVLKNVAKNVRKVLLLPQNFSNGTYYTQAIILVLGKEEVP